MTQKWILRYYFVAFIDVLGQSKELLKLVKLPVTQIEIENTSQILHDTAGYLISLRKIFNDFFESCNKSSSILDSLPQEKRTIANELRTTKANITSLSDTIVITIPLDNEDKNCLSITNIHSALYGICGIFLHSLALRKPFRCGVDIGLGVPLSENEIYGPTLIKAYALENNIAIYPRIVIGDSFFKYINLVQGLNSNNIYEEWAKKVAGECSALICQDLDKLRILDVIGSSVKSITGGVDKQLVEKAYTFIVQSHDNFQNSDDVKMRSRYGMLRNYFESRISLWDIKPIKS